MRIPENVLTEIRDKLDITEVISEHVALQRKGGRYWGLCPFHQEKSPSFTVTPEKGVFYCFGCHKGGTVFDFIMEVEKIPWRDAVELLAKKAGIEIPREEEQRDGINRGDFFELYRRVAGSFHWLLTEGPQAEHARRYLAGRGVRPDIIERFQLGYAPAERDWLFRFLTQKSYSEDFLGKVGLFADSSRGAGGAFFFDRIVFPIANPRGEIIAFGGRALGEAKPKYLNSPETAFFRKGENLFAIDKAATAIRREGFFILVEGYMDVLAMHQAGIENCVAPLGTALTPRQVKLLKRYAARGILLFDGDAAGQKATERAIEMLESQDVIVQVIELQGEKDPADFVQKGEEGRLREVLSHPQEGFPYLLARALSTRDRASVEGREGIRDFLFPFVAAAASSMRQDGYLSLMADSLDADAQAVRQDFFSWKGRQRVISPVARDDSGTAVAAREPAGQPEQASVPAELFLMLAVTANRDLFPLVRNAGIALTDLEDERAKALFIALEEAYRAEEQGFEALRDRIEDPRLRDLVMSKVASGEFDMNQERIVRDGVRRIRQRTLRKKSDALSAEMRREEKASRDPNRMRELLAEKMHLDSELARLKTGAAGA